MDELIALHTTDRHACIDRVAFWEALAEQTKHSPKSSLSFESAWTHVSVVEAILRGIERMIPGEFASLGELCVALRQAAYEAIDPHTEPFDEVQPREMPEEQAYFVALVGSLTADDLRQVRPLPYRHVLTDRETRRVLRRVERRWNMHGPYWYPLLPDPTPPHLLAVQAA